MALGVELLVEHRLADLVHVLLVAEVQRERADVAVQALEGLVAERRPRAADVERPLVRSSARRFARCSVRIDASSASSCRPASQRSAAAHIALAAANSSEDIPPSSTRVYSEPASSGRSRTQPVAKSSAAAPAPRWFAANASVNVRGSLLVHAPGAPMSRSGGTT